MRAAAVGLALLALAACATITRNHGYVPPDADLALIEVGRDTRETVAATIGRPSTSGLLNDVGWYYVQSRFETVGGRAPLEVDRQVVAITFTPEGVVENIERFGLEDGQVVVLSRRVTTPNVKSQGFLRQLFGNIGRIDTSQIFGD
jgi:outer membrane protein assembly factor BamE (lipoprotein component of BamABCDE complex)